MKISLMCAITLDGKIARNEHHFVDWSSREDKRLFFATTKRAGVLIIGNNTYRTFSAPLPGRLHIVLTSDTSDKINIPGQVEYTSASPEEIAADLKARGFEEAILAGGGQVNTLFLKANLIDELLLTLEPVVFGSGIDLFRSGELDARWRLVHMEKLNDIGSLHLRYTLAPNS
nr:RibD C-terminal domain protein [uncultured bacterium]